MLVEDGFGMIDGEFIWKLVEQALKEQQVVLDWQLNYKKKIKKVLIEGDFSRLS